MGIENPARVCGTTAHVVVDVTHNGLRLRRKSLHSYFEFCELYVPRMVNAL